MGMMPKRVKHRKQMRGKLKGLATRGNRVTFGDYGLMSLDYGWINGRHIEAGRVAANRATGGSGKVWIRSPPSPPRPGWARARETSTSGQPR